MKSILAILALATSMTAQAVEINITNFCPVSGKKQSMKDMYKPMSLGYVWGHSGDDRNPIVFVDEEDTLVSPIKETYEEGFEGTFKIGYNYKAKECRRQIILDKEIKLEIKSPDGELLASINSNVNSLFPSSKQKKTYTPKIFVLKRSKNREIEHLKCF